MGREICTNVENKRQRQENMESAVGREARGLQILERDKMLKK